MRIKFSAYSSDKLFKCFALIFKSFLKLCDEFLDLFVVMIVVAVVVIKAILIFLLLCNLCVFKDFDLVAL